MRINWDIGIDIYILPYIKQRASKDLLHTTGNFTQCSVMACVGKEEWLDVYLYLIHFAVHLKLIHCQSSLLQ